MLTAIKKGLSAFLQYLCTSARSKWQCPLLLTQRLAPSPPPETKRRIYGKTCYSFELGRFDDALRCIHEAITGVEATKETWHEVDIRRIAGEIALMGPEPDTAKAQGYFERALAVARQQQAKSWELRAAMSMARLWRDQGKRDEARDARRRVMSGIRGEASARFALDDPRADIEGLHHRRVGPSFGVRQPSKLSRYIR
jgi:hypothetical protein